MRRKLIGICEAQKLYGSFWYDRPKYVEDGKCLWCGNDIPQGTRSKQFCCKEQSLEFNRATSSVYYASGADSGYRRQMFRRDNYTCQDCGELHAYQNEYGVYLPTTDGKLDLHHINPVEYGGGDEPKNLITLCRECHKKRHRAIEKALAERRCKS